MSIEYRGDGKYRFRIRKDGVNYTQQIDGKKLSEKEIADKKYPKAIQDAHKEFEVSIKQGKIGANENMKFAELAQLVMDEYVKPNLGKNTKGTYLNAYNDHILPEFGHIPISKIKKIHVQQFVNKKVKEEMKHGSIKLIISKMSVAFNKAIEWDILKTDNPCSLVKIPKNRKCIGKQNYSELLSLEQISKLIECINNEPPTFKAIFLTALGTGLRKGEVLGLKLENVDFTNNLIKLTGQRLAYHENGQLFYEDAPTKNGCERELYMPDFVSTELQKFIKNMKIINLAEPHIFINPKTNKPYSHSWVSVEFKKMLKENNLPELTFHKLRHLQAVLSIASGIDIVTVAARLGDTVETVSSTYLHSIKAVEKEATQKLEKYMNSFMKK